MEWKLFQLVVAERQSAHQIHLIKCYEMKDGLKDSFIQFWPETSV